MNKSIKIKTIDNSLSDSQSLYKAVKSLRLARDRRFNNRALVQQLFTYQTKEKNETPTKSS